MALTNFGKAVVSSIGLGLVGVFISAAAPAFADTDADVLAGYPAQSAQIVAATDRAPAPKLNLLLLPNSADPGTRIG